MKKTTAKKLLLSTERVRNLNASDLRGARGGVCPVTGGSGGDPGCGATDPAPPPGGCTITGHTTIRCINSNLSN